MNNATNFPRHVGIIMDGNGRWATERGLSRSSGHKEGAKALKKLFKYVYKKGIKVLSVYAFSTENFKRSKDEVGYLMGLFVQAFKKEFKTLEEEKIRVVFSGRRYPLPKDVLDAMDEVVNRTKENTNGILNICINYGGKQEIVDMTKKLCEKFNNKEIEISDINEELVNNNMYNELPDVDLVIRTSGELRISNFLLWQAAYAEYYFPKVYFPDFDEKQFDLAIEEYNKRNRRFGGIK